MIKQNETNAYNRKAKGGYLFTHALQAPVGNNDW